MRTRIGNPIAKIVLFFVHHVGFRQHALVQDTRNQDASRCPTVKHDMFAVLHAVQAGANMNAEST